jgi:hypothetical protein
MRLVMTLLVRDEEEVLEDNLDYHFNRGVDFVLVTDHASQDGTPEILRRYEADGVLRVIRESAENFDQAALVSRMARVAATDLGADWVFHADADEFWWPQAGSIKDVLAGVPDELGVLELPRRDFVARPPGTGRFHQWMTVREVESLNPRGYPLEPKIAHRAHPEAQVTDGSHAVQAPGLEYAPRLPLIEVFHFQVRTYEQFEAKVVKMGTAFERSPETPPDVGQDQRDLYEVYKAGGLPDRFRELLVEEGELEAGLAGGRLIEDRRLADFMAAAAQPPVPPPADPAARQFARRLIARVDHLEREERRLRAEVIEVGSERLRLHEHALEVGDAYGAALDELAAVRNSKLMRWTAPARRLFYRLSRKTPPPPTGPSGWKRNS